MKNALRATALTCAVLALGFGLSSSPASATNNDDVVRTAQMRLASLGYYVGRYDGAMGPVTQSAIKDFQRAKGLAATGQLTPETFSLLEHKDYVAFQPAYYAPRADVGTYNMAYGNQLVLATVPVVWDTRWHYVRSQEIPSRYAQLSVNEDDRGSLRHYAVTLNGHPVLFANNQPQLLRVSKTFAMNNEDAVIFTAYHGDGACAYKSYLLTIHNDGTFSNPHEIGNCTGNVEAHVADNALLISFPEAYVAGGLSTYDVWRYENDRLAHI